MLSSNIKGGFPLRIEVEKVMVELYTDFLKNMFVKIEWNALVEASKTLGYSELPENAESGMLSVDEFLQKFHHALLELHLEEGALVCPETGRKFPVSKGIFMKIHVLMSIYLWSLVLKIGGGWLLILCLEMLFCCNLCAQLKTC
ncbi:hypothetical protein ACS0TY_033458 [Phlomoides rotata]